MVPADVVFLAPKGALSSGEHNTMLRPHIKTPRREAPRVVLPTCCVHTEVDPDNPHIVKFQCRRPVVRTQSGFLCEEHEEKVLRRECKPVEGVLLRAPYTPPDGKSIVVHEALAIQGMRNKGQTHLVRLLTNGVNTVYMEVGKLSRPGGAMR